MFATVFQSRLVGFGRTEQSQLLRCLCDCNMFHSHLWTACRAMKCISLIRWKRIHTDVSLKHQPHSFWSWSESFCLHLCFILDDLGLYTEMFIRILAFNRSDLFLSMSAHGVTWETVPGDTSCTLSLMLYFRAWLSLNVSWFTDQ